MENDKRMAQFITDECNSGDEEEDHLRADEIILDLLKDLGYYETVEAFNKVRKYYA